MTLDKAQKNLQAMMSVNRALVKLNNSSAKRVLGLLLKAFSGDADREKTELTVFNFCAKRLEGLNSEEALATIKYLIDLHYNDTESQTSVGKDQPSGSYEEAEAIEEAFFPDLEETKGA